MSLKSIALGYSKGGAYRRMIAARLVVRYPVIAD
jgi:hypothetical protein